MLDLDVIWRNLPFLMLQGFLGVGNFVGGTLRLAIPSIVLGFVLGIFIGIARLAPPAWIRLPATLYVEFFRGVPLETNADYYVRVSANASPRSSGFVWPWQGADALGFAKFTFIR